MGEDVFVLTKFGNANIVAMILCGGRTELYVQTDLQLKYGMRICD